MGIGKFIGAALVGSVIASILGRPPARQESHTDVDFNWVNVEFQEPSGNWVRFSSGPSNMLIAHEMRRAAKVNPGRRIRATDPYGNLLDVMNG